MKTLLVGFGPYAGDKENPAEKIVRSFSSKDVKPLVLDASYAKVRKLDEVIAKEKPDFVITLNLSPFRKEPAIEEYAYNEMNSVQPDIEGQIMLGEKIVESGPKSLNCPLDIPSIQQYLASRGNAIAISIDPGRFVCNEASYLARLSGVPSLSLHVPLEKDFPIAEEVEIIEGLIEYFEASR
ncbi:MAG: hypothetical protein E7182_01115 [Erysipelotrichaceae bacterium]|nr:hypothetical protein [Erysipelotrichaceae bacterium]